MDVVNTLQQIGATIGIPAVLLLGWMLMQIKSLTKRVDKIEAEHQSLQATLSQIQTDIAVIRTKLEYMVPNDHERS